MTITLSPKISRLTVALLVLAVGVVAGMAVSAAMAGAVVEDTAYTAVTPCVSFDSRTDTGTLAGKYTDSEVKTFKITGVAPAVQQGGVDCDVPAGAKAVLINVVAIQADTIGNLRAFATGDTGTGGIVNYSPVSPGMNNSNAVVIPLSAAGQLDIENNCGGCPGLSVHARGIVLGYYTNSLAVRVAALENGPSSGRINLAIGDFVPRTNTEEFFSSAYGINATGNFSAEVTAPVHLPQGATITKLVLVGIDNTGNGIIRGFLYRTRITPTASGTTIPFIELLANPDSTACNCNSIREMADTTINEPVVDINQYAYSLFVQISPGSTIRLTAAYIEYAL